MCALCGDPREQALAVNHFVHDMRALLNEFLDVPLTDEREAVLKLDGLVGLCGGMRTLVRRIADEQAERMNEPADSGWVEDWNRSMR